MTTAFHLAYGRSACWESTDELEILPGLPDDVTINNILTRLPWRMLYVGALVSRLWKKTVRSSQLQDARVYNDSAETVVAIVHMDPSQGYHSWRQAISLYDSSTDTWHLLPRLPGACNRIPWSSGCVSLRGRLYVLGGLDENFPEGRNVHYFDLAGQSGWTERARMNDGRRDFACTVKDGKVYVFGGTYGEEDARALCASEVYDPEKDAWVTIKPMLSNRIDHKVVISAGNFFVQTGRLESSDVHDRTFGHYPRFAEVYQPIKDEWRKVENFTTNNKWPEVEFAEFVIVIDGILHKILDQWLYVYDEPSQSWTRAQSISWDALKRKGSSSKGNFRAQSSSFVVAGGELLGLVYCQENVANSNRFVIRPLKSLGLGRRDHPICWKEIKSSLHFDSAHRVCSIQI